MDAAAAGGPIGQATLLDLAPARNGDVRRLVEVAIDAVGAGGTRLYTYDVPPRLAGVEPGEAVLVEFGRRQALAIVMGEGAPVRGTRTKPLVERVRADGPLLPPLSLRLARWISETYLAPPSIVLRAMLPPAMLERLELVAERLPNAIAGTEGRGGAEGLGGTGRPAAEGLASAEGRAAAYGPAGTEGLAAADLALLEQLEGSPSAVRDLVSPEGRAGLIRRLRALAGRGLVSLEWTLTAAAAGPRYERWIMLTDDGLATARALAGGERPAGRPLGPRQIALLGDLLSAAETPDRTDRELTATPAEGGAGGMPGALLAARHGTSAVAGLVRRGLVSVDVRERPRRPLDVRAPGLRGARPPATDLGPEQRAAVDLVREAIAAGDPTPLLLDGVTGAGKTAIYVESIAETLRTGRPALVLVPEIALALPLIDRLRADLDATVAVIHSGLGEGERADEWRRVREGGVDIVVGTRLAVLAPLRDVGLVVVDEEHDAAYKSDRTPRLQARDAAIALGRLAGAAVVLGSATPAVDSYGRAQRGEYRRIALPSRLSGTPPVIEIVDLRAELAAGNRGLLSRRLSEALTALDTERGDRAILVINRRGTASVVMCRDCGAVQRCPECDRPLVFHQAGYTLRCHNCGTASPLASRCPSCASPRIRYLGGGTERVEREVRERFPQLRVGRLDRDVMERKGAADRLIDAFARGGVDVLVGTSLVTKGLDVPEVTLVGVVSADVALNLPDERAAERTYQLLAQAVGRAGRGERPGRAIIQSYQPDHPAIVAVATSDAATFYESELALRRRFGSPPFGRLVKLTVAIGDRTKAEHEAQEMADRLRVRASERGSDVLVAGPAPAYIAKRGDRWRFNLAVRGQAPSDLLDGGLDAPWSVDVDPDSLL